MWADRFLQFFRVNRQILQHAKDLERSLEIAEGRILTLREWNKSLQDKNNRLEEIIYKRYGLIPQSESSTTEISDKPIIMSETWRTAQAKLQDIYRKGGPLQGKVDDILNKQNKYWDEKLKSQEEARSKAADSSQGKIGEEQTPENVAGSN